MHREDTLRVKQPITTAWTPGGSSERRRLRGQTADTDGARAVPRLGADLGQSSSFGRGEEPGDRTVVVDARPSECAESH